MALADCIQKTGFSDVDQINELIEGFKAQGNTQGQAEHLALQEYGKTLEEELGGVLDDGVRFQVSPEVGTKAFDRFKGDAREVSGLEVQDLKSGEPVLIRAYHGTTNEFYEFDSSVKGNIEGHLGKINYFTSDYQDAAQNYQSDGADLTSRIDRRQDELDDTLRYDYQDSEEGLEFSKVVEDFNITPEEVSDLYPSGPPDFIQAEEISRFIAEKELQGSEEQVMDLYVKLNNPLVLGNKSTWVETIPFEDYEDSMDDAAEEIADEFGVSIEEAKEDYDYDVRLRAQEIEGIYDNKIVEAMSEALSNNGYDSGIASEVLGESSYESEIDMNVLEQRLRSSDVQLYDNEDGELASSQVIADFFENLGYDGIILTDVSKRFPGLMQGFGDGVSHIHVFDQYNNQIKLASGENTTFDDGTSDIRFQKSDSEPVIFTAWNVDNVSALKKKYPPVHPNEFYHHSTNVFGSQPLSGRDGEKKSLRVTGRLTTDKVDALIVDNPDSNNEFPHITLSTAEGVKPFASNKEIQENQDKIKKVEDEIDVTFRDNLKRGKGGATSDTGDTSDPVIIKEVKPTDRPIRLQLTSRNFDEKKIKRATIKELKGAKAFVFAADRLATGNIESPTGVKEELMGGFFYPYQDKVGAWAFTTEDAARKVLNKINDTDGIGLVMIQAEDGIKGSFSFAEYVQKEYQNAIKKGAKETEILEFINGKLDVNLKKGVSFRDILKKKSGKSEFKKISDLLALMPIEGDGKFSYEERGGFYEKILNAENEKRFGIPRFKYGEKVKSRPNPAMVDYLNDPKFSNLEYGDVVGAIQFEKKSPIIDTRKGKDYKTHPSYPFIVKGKPLFIFENAYDVRDIAPDFAPVSEKANQTPLKERDKPQAARSAMGGQPLVRFQKTPPENANDNFYSNSLRAINRIPQSKGTFDQWKAMLLKNGASQAELDWIGFDDQFKGKRPTKEEVFSFIANNKVDIEEVDGSLLITRPNTSNEPISDVKAMPVGETLDVEQINGESGNIIERALIKYATEQGLTQVSFLDKVVDISPVMRYQALSEGMPMFQKTPTVEPSPAIEKQWGDSVRRRVQDRYVMLKRLQEGKQGDKMLDEHNSYVKENLQSGKANEKERQYEERIWQPMSKHLRKLVNTGVSYDEISRYLKAKHIVDDQIEAGGIPIPEAQELVKAMQDRVKQKDLDKLHSFIRQMQLMSLGLQYESGIISKKKYDQMKDEFKFYVPLRGFNDVMDMDPTKFTGNHNRKGRSSESGDPISYLEQMIKTDIIKGEQNKVKLAFLNFMKNNPDSRVYSIENVWYIKQEDGSYEVTDKTPTKEQIDSGEATRQPDLDSLDADQLRKLSEHALLQGTDMAMTVLENGRRVRVQFRGPEGEDLVRAFKGTKTDQANGVLKYLQKAHAVLRGLYTQYSPEFALRNAIRDFVSGTMNVRADFGNKVAFDVTRFVMSGKAWKTVQRGLDQVTKKDRLFKDDDGAYFKEYLEQGAMTGYSSMKELSDVYKNKKREIEGIKSNMLYKSGKAIIDFIDIQNSIIENTVRFAAYRTLRKKGHSPQKAAIYSKDLTVNFNRKGEMTNSLNSIFLFFNAGVQGIDRLTRPYASKDGKVKARAWGNVVAAGMTTLSMTMQAVLMGGEDDDGVPYYFKLPDYVRTHNMVFAVGENKFITVPLPYGHNLPFAITSITMDVAMGEAKPKDASLMLMGAIFEAFSPIGAPNFEDRPTEEALLEVASPTIIKPILDISWNRNFAGNPIYKEPFSKNAPTQPSSQMYFKNINPMYQLIAEGLNDATGGSKIESGWIDINPEKLEHLVTSYTGGVGSFINNSWTSAAYLIQGESMLKEDRVRKVPFFRNYYKEASPYYDQSRFYEIMDQVKKHRDIYKAYVDSGLYDEAKKYYMDNRRYFKINGGRPTKNNGRWNNGRGLDERKDLISSLKGLIEQQEKKMKTAKTIGAPTKAFEKKIEEYEAKMQKEFDKVYKLVEE